MLILKIRLFSIVTVDSYRLNFSIYKIIVG